MGVSYVWKGFFGCGTFVFGVQPCFCVDLTQLANKYQTDKGSEVPCAHYYTRHYEKLFGKYLDKEFSLLEIGLNRSYRTDCASLRMWLDYFPKAKVYGVDIVPQIFSHERASIFLADQTKLNSLETLVSRLPKGLDIIIDDGLHSSWAQQITWIKLFPTLKPGGFYAIEDLHFQPIEESGGLIKTRAFFENISESRDVSIPGIPQELLASQVRDIGDLMWFDSKEKWPEMPACHSEKRLAVCLVVYEQDAIFEHVLFDSAPGNDLFCLCVAGPDP